MKHSGIVTLLMIGLFLVSQAAGLAILAFDLDIEQLPDGTVAVSHPETAWGVRPDLGGLQLLGFLGGAILAGTILLLVLIRFKVYKLWKLWYFLAVSVAASLALDVFLDNTVAIILGFVLAGLKILKPQHILQNVTEILMYSGLAVLFVPLLEVQWAVLLLILISLYDMYAVWHSKHMVKLAKFTSDTQLFAGFSIPYKKQKNHSTILPKLPKGTTLSNSNKGSTKIAILGGGDIAFPLLLAGSTMEWMIQGSATIGKAYVGGLFVAVGAAIGLGMLLYYSKKNTFYPAMPPITLGCIVGLAATLIL